MDSFDSMIERYKKELIDAKRRSIYDEINDVIKENSENQIKEYETEQNPIIKSPDYDEGYGLEESDNDEVESVERPTLISAENDEQFDDDRSGRGDGINMDNAAKALIKDPLPKGNYPDSTGTLRIQVFAADRVYPISSARVRVTGSGGNKIFFDGLTDSSGIVDNVVLPAPSNVYSQEPSLTRPYSLYDLSVDHPGFISQRFLNVPVFSGIKSVQNVQLVPGGNNRGNEPTVTITKPEELFGDGE